jgi:hypothetical protein
MTDQLSNLLIVTGVLLGLFFLWVLSIGITYWDVSRRNLPRSEVAAWMALVVVLPGLGFAAYLLMRLVGAFLSPGRSQGARPRHRVTLVKRDPELDRHTGTIPAADLFQTTLPGISPALQAAPSSEPQAPCYRLAVLAGPQAGREFVLNSLPVKIGRGPEAVVRLDGDLGVSRQHAEIYQQAGVLRIRDLKSTHGTQVNDFSIDDKSLDPGDRIRVGVSILLVGLQEQA